MPPETLIEHTNRVTQGESLKLFHVNVFTFFMPIIFTLFFFSLFIFILSEFSPTLIEKVHETLMWLKKVGHYPAILNKHLTFLFGSPKFMTY